MDFFNLPVGKRTRHQRLSYAQGLNGIDGSSKIQDRKRNREKEVSESKDGYEVIEIEDDDDNHNKSNGAGRSTKRKLDATIKVEKSSSDESDSEEEENSENGSVDSFRSSESDEFSSDEFSEDSSDGEGSEDPSRSNKVDKSSSSKSGKDESDEKGFDGTKSRTCGSSCGYGQDDIEIIDVDAYWINRKGSKGSSCSTKRKLDEAKPVYKSLVDESKGEHSNANGSIVVDKGKRKLEE